MHANIFCYQNKTGAPMQRQANDSVLAASNVNNYQLFIQAVITRFAMKTQVFDNINQGCVSCPHLVHPLSTPP